MSIWLYQKNFTEQLAQVRRNLGLSGWVDRKRLFLDPIVHPYRALSKSDNSLIARYSNIEAAFETARCREGIVVTSEGSVINYPTCQSSTSK